MNSKKKLLFVCQSKSCLKRGSDAISKSLKSHIKTRGLKKEVRVVGTKCIDSCKFGPNIVCDASFYQEVTAENIEEIVNMCVETHVGNS